MALGAPDGVSYIYILAFLKRGKLKNYSMNYSIGFYNAGLNNNTTCLNSA